MSARYLLDSNVLSEEVLDRPNPNVLQQIRARSTEIATASVVWHELWYGALRLPPSRRRRTIEQYLREVIGTTIPVLPYDQGAAVWHAAERDRLAAQGHTPAFADGQIASIARVNGLILVTRNVPDFVRFEGLQMENWHT